MDVLDVYDKAMARFDQLVELIESNHWAAPTPCTEWTVYDLLNHLVVEQLWVPSLLSGATLTEVGDRFDGDQLGHDPQRSWRHAATAAKSAWFTDGVLRRRVHVSGGIIPATEYCWQMTTDLAVHGWDLATAIGADNRIPQDVCQAVFDYVKPRAREWQDIGIVAPPVAVPSQAGIQEKLLGLLGRQP